MDIRKPRASYSLLQPDRSHNQRLAGEEKRKGRNQKGSNVPAEMQGNAGREVQYLLARYTLRQNRGKKAAGGGGGGGGKRRELGV